MGKASMVWLLLVGLLIFVAFAVGLYTVGGGTAESSKLRPDDEALTRLGAEIYAQSCASCHGTALEGEKDWRSRNADGTLKAPPHNETGHTWHHPDEFLFRITKFGTEKGVGLEDFKSDMPAFEDILTDREIFAVLSWIKAQWPNQIRERHDMMNERARNANR